MGRKAVHHWILATGCPSENSFSLTTDDVCFIIAFFLSILRMFSSDSRNVALTSVNDVAIGWSSVSVWLISICQCRQSFLETIQIIWICLWFLGSWVTRLFRIVISTQILFFSSDRTAGGPSRYSFVKTTDETSRWVFNFQTTILRERESLLNKSLTVLGLKEQQGLASHVKESKS